jgi:hypothetical protein
MHQDRFDELAKALATNDLSQLRFGRSRFLRLLGLGLLGGLAATFIAPREAEAQQEAEDQQTPTTTSPCHGSPECSSGCSGAQPDFTPSPNTCYTEGGYVGNCWYGEARRSDRCTDIWVCCDYLVDGTTDPCFCSTYITTQC